MLSQKFKYSLLSLFMVLSFSWVQAQSQQADTTQQIDASKPTNFYTQIFNNLEYNSRQTGGNLFGYRAEFVYSPNPTHLILGELPLLYNDASKKFGLGDVRARYFYLPYKNYDKFLGAFGPSIDVFLPTGSYENGLGSSSVVVSPGITAGLMLADWIQAFPIFSYQFTTKPTAEQIPVDMRRAQQGLTFQIITPIIFSEKFFAQVTPIYTASNITNEGQDRYIQELLFQYALREKLQISMFYRGVFKDDDHTVRMGLVVYL